MFGQSWRFRATRARRALPSGSSSSSTNSSIDGSLIFVSTGALFPVSLIVSAGAGSGFAGPLRTPVGGQQRGQQGNNRRVAHAHRLSGRLSAGLAVCRGVPRRWTSAPEFAATFAEARTMKLARRRRSTRSAARADAARLRARLGSQACRLWARCRTRADTRGIPAAAGDLRVWLLRAGHPAWRSRPTRIARLHRLANGSSWAYWTTAL